MQAETNLQTLLATLKPTLTDEVYVFCTLRSAVYGDHRELNPIASFAEEEGLTLVVARDQAMQKSLDFQGEFRRIILGVHSSLEAVGLTAAIATRLSEQGISANVIAAFYHDHLFVPASQADRAMDALRF
jgi:hypothetical protein